MSYTIHICPICGKQDELIRVCQHFDPDERYITTVEVEVEVVGIAEGESEGPPRINGPYPDGEDVERYEREEEDAVNEVERLKAAWK